MSLALTKVDPELVLLVFIHGFKGSDETFGEFPQRLAHNLSQTLPNATVEPVIFPAYEVRNRSVLSEHTSAQTDCIPIGRDL